MYIPDNYDAFKSLEASYERHLENLPVCSECGEKIEGEHCYVIGGELFCEDCIDSFRDATLNHMGE